MHTLTLLADSVVVTYVIHVEDKMNLLIRTASAHLPQPRDEFLESNEACRVETRCAYWVIVTIHTLV